MGYGYWDDNTYLAGKTSVPRAVSTTSATPIRFGRVREAVGKRTRPPTPSASTSVNAEIRRTPRFSADSSAFDVTGSMGAVPRIMQDKLGKLHGLLQRKGYADDPQILFAVLCDGILTGCFKSDSSSRGKRDGRTATHDFSRRQRRRSEIGKL